MEVGRGTRVLVTGASRGIGRALAGAFAARGAELGLLSRSRKELEEVAKALPGEGHRVLIADVADAGGVRSAADSFGACDVAVANAGVAHSGPFADMDAEHVEAMTRVNWLGTTNTVAAVLGHMLERRCGHVVVVSSGAALRSFPGAAVYGATKAAQRAFAEALWHELDGTGVSVTTVFPGEFASGLHAHELDALPGWNRRHDALPPEQLAEHVVRAVEDGDRAVYQPPLMRALRVMHGVSPRLGDLALRRLRGPAAAPRRG